MVRDKAGPYLQGLKGSVRNREFSLSIAVHHQSAMGRMTWSCLLQWQQSQE